MVITKEFTRTNKKLEIITIRDGLKIGESEYDLLFGGSILIFRSDSGLDSWRGWMDGMGCLLRLNLCQFINAYIMVDNSKTTMYYI